MAKSVYSLLANLGARQLANFTEEMGFNIAEDAINEACMDHERRECLSFIEQWINLKTQTPAERRSLLFKYLSKISRLSGSWSVFPGPTTTRREFLAGPMNGEWDERKEAIANSPFPALLKYYNLPHGS